MPIARQHAWIKRPQEDYLFDWLENKRPLYWPIIGGGGAGKTSLLRKFQEHAESKNIASVFIDPPKLISAYGPNGLSFLLNIEASNAPSFKKTKETIISSTKQLSAILLDSALGSDEALKSIGSQVKDEEWGLVIGTIKDALKIARSTLDHKANKDLAVIKEKPEELLINSLYSDLQKGGLILVDTWEQSSSLEIVSQLEFRENGEIDASSIERKYSIRDYLSGLIYYIFDLNVLFVVAGRHVPAEITSLDARNIASKSNTTPFSQLEIREYFNKSINNLPTTTNQVGKVHALTRGNPLLVSKLTLLIKEEISVSPNWTWDDWEITKNEEFDILETLVERLVMTSGIDIDSFWKIVLPKYLFIELFDILFSDDLSEADGNNILSELEDKGILYKDTNKKQVYIHDEIRSAIKSYAIKKGYWLSESASNIHGRLSEYFYQKGRGEKQKLYILEGSYHALMADSRFEERYSVAREEFWNNVGNSLSLDVSEKKEVIDNITGLTSREINQLIEIFTEEKEKFSELSEKYPLDVLRLCLHRTFGDIHEALSLFYSFAKELPKDYKMYLYLASNKDFSKSERASWYANAIKHDTTGKEALVSYAIYLCEDEGQIEKAERIFVELIEGNKDDENLLITWLQFVYNHLSEEEYNQQVRTMLQTSDMANNIARVILGMEKLNKPLLLLLKEVIAPEISSPEVISRYVRHLANRENDIKRASKLLEDSIKLNPNDDVLLTAYAEFNEFVLNDPEGAKSVYLRMGAKISDEIPLLLKYGKLLAFKLNSENEAFQLFEKILQIDEYHFETLVLLGRLSWSKLDYKLAEKYFRLALSLDPSDAELILRVGLILISKGNIRGRNLICAAVDGEISRESEEIQLEILFYGFCCKENLEKLGLLAKLGELIEAHPSVRIDNYHNTLFSDVTISDYINWGNTENILHGLLTKQNDSMGQLLTHHIEQLSNRIKLNMLELTH
uniref:Tetratricopeptide repeat-containing protein n=1 Tax=Candidatus Kentrum sp. DK TaxID=2126562 RepID=A0A450SVQ4_9GAMM|nr:MAG: Tetratricopeptide repeat-containing protein [Candidatus Kentron sp. DK]